MGAHSVSAPYAELDASPESISVSFKGGTFSFPSGLVEKVAPFPGLHMQGIEIVHASPNLPRPAIFWTLSPDSTREALRALGYKVVDPEP